MSLKENLTHFSLDLSQNYLKEMTGLHACHRSADLKITARVCGVWVCVCKLQGFKRKSESSGGRGLFESFVSSNMILSAKVLIYNFCKIYNFCSAKP